MTGALLWFGQIGNLGEYFGLSSPIHRSTIFGVQLLLGMRPIGRSILRWREDHARGGRLALVMTYPHYLHLRDIVRPDLQV